MAYRVVRKYGVKIWLGRPKHRWEKNIKRGLNKIKTKDVAWIHLA
jgi:hypothetical protein